MTAAPVAVSARGWGWRHAGRRGWAVRGLDLDVAPGERVLLLGASGSGKSTLLAGLAGLLDPDDGGGSGDGGDGGGGGGDGDGGGGEQEGELRLDGVPARRARLEGVGAGRARTGLLLQDPLAQTVLARCGDDVAFGLENHAVPPAQIWPRVERALAAIGFPYPLVHPTSRLSGGERQRLALAGVLALRPGLLLLDEPTAMLDPDGAALLREAVLAVQAATGATTVLVEHRVAPWVGLVDRVVVLAPGGGVAADGTPGDVLGGRGAALAAAGVWVPGHLPVAGRLRGPRRPAGGGELLLTARDVAVTRVPGGPPAVRGAALDVVAGRVTCVVGPNGAGKSSLALALAGLVRPTTGEVVARGPLAAGVRSPHPVRWRPRELVARIGTVFQEPQHQFVAATAADELAVGPRRTGVGEAETAARVGALLDRLRLGHLARANPFTLSGGEQRRLSVATVLATRPRVLVLDEPTFGQDARTWAELVDLLAGLVDEGTGVVAVTHDERLVEALGDDVVRLGNDRAGAGEA